MTLEWRGPQIQRRVRRASLRGVDSTIEAAVKRAKKKHPGWTRRTGGLEESIQVFEPARETRDGVEGTWGSDAFYAFFQEFGTAHMRPNPFLRPSARTSNKRLKFRVRANFKKGV